MPLHERKRAGLALKKSGKVLQALDVFQAGLLASPECTELLDLVALTTTQQQSRTDLERFQLHQDLHQRVHLG
ncbi:hypothetical protein T484DRAFT_1803997 [Baffinella frigidus]|nr:hypothetical protein T484DRAFT_1803997 [Cryptophyta sp. CCMP2293]